MRLPALWRKPLFAVHLMAAIGWFGTSLALLSLGVAGARGSNPATVYPAAHLVGAWLTAPLAVIALATGVLQAVLTGWGLTKHRWVTVKLTVAAILTVLVIFVLVPELGRAADTVTGPEAQPLGFAERIRLVVGPAVACLLLTLNVILAIYKPERQPR
jgi:purine-cytosine permease-like protein